MSNTHRIQWNNYTGYYDGNTSPALTIVNRVNEDVTRQYGDLENAEEYRATTGQYPALVKALTDNNTEALTQIQDWHFTDNPADYADFWAA